MQAYMCLCCGLVILLYLLIIINSIKEPFAPQLSDKYKYTQLRDILEKRANAIKYEIQQIAANYQTINKITELLGAGASPQLPHK